MSSRSIDDEEEEKKMDLDEPPREIYKKKFKRFSGLSRRQLGLFLVSAFSFIVSFSWNTFAQNVFTTVIPSNLKNSSTILILLQLVYALIVTLVGAVTIAYVNSRPNRVKDENKDFKKLHTYCAEIRDDVHKMKEALENPTL